MIPGEPFGWHRLYRRISSWSPWSGDQPSDVQIGWLWTQHYSVLDLGGILQYCSATSGGSPYMIQDAVGAAETPAWYIVWRKWPPSGLYRPWTLQAWIHTTPSEALQIAKALQGCTQHPSVQDILFTDQQNKRVV
jgi:hypothetical protein